MTCPSCWGKSKACAHCKGTGTTPDVQLSPSFKLSELIKSNTAKAKSIPNVPDARIIENLKSLAVAMEPYKGAFGDRMSINSGYRCPALNKAIGGTSDSAHCQGFAVDFVVSGMDATAIMRWTIANYPAPWDQAIDEPGWFHLGHRSPDGKRQRKQTLVMRGGKYTEFPKV